ncbi:MAG: serine hydrolase [Porticoccaceae bacterium]|nr:serine hydrolase [Porticoccaceae bacterium]
MKSVILFRSTLLFIIATSSANAATDNSRFDGVRATIETHIINSDIPSAAVAVAKDGKFIWQQGFGLANEEEKISATEHTLYSLASISKPVAATGLMVLVEKGLLDLDKPANYYLDSTKLTAYMGDAKDATVRRLANHTSGIPAHFHPIYEDNGKPAPSMDESIRRYGNITMKPGELFQYSNFAFGVIDYIVERVSGQTYNAFYA